MPVLSERLKKIAQFIRKGHRVADIGTDHAYLPIYLRESGLCPFVIASDIRVSPLNSAMKNVKKAGADGIDFRLCDGLLGIEKDEIDLEAKTSYVDDYVRTHKTFSFRKLLEKQGSKMEVIVTFLVILEMMKVGRISIVQENIFDDILITSNEAEG